MEGKGGDSERGNMTLMRGAGLVVLTPEGVRQRSDISRTAFELRSLARPCLSSLQLSGEVPPFPTPCRGTAMVPCSVNASKKNKGEMIHLGFKYWCGELRKATPDPKAVELQSSPQMHIVSS